MHLPRPRGALSTTIVDTLRRARPEPTDPSRASGTEDAALTLWVLHELSFAGFHDVDDRLEWHPDLLRLRHDLEGDLEERLLARFDGVPQGASDDLATTFFDYVGRHDGPSVARHVHTVATEEQAIELLRWRSVYHLKETDPSSFVLARLPRAARAALAELLYDEYGAGRPERLHSQLFADALRSVGLDPDGCHVDAVPTEVLEMNNSVSMFGFQRRLRGAAMGHLAAFECTSSGPARRLAQGFQRLGLPQAVVDYYAEHVVADAVHEQLAVRQILLPLVEADPDQLAPVFLGAFTCLDQEARTARVLLDRWDVAA